MFGKSVIDFIKDNRLETSKISFVSENSICFTHYINAEHTKEVDYQLWFNGLNDESGNMVYETIRYLVWRNGESEPIIDKLITREISFKMRLHYVKNLFGLKEESK